MSDPLFFQDAVRTPLLFRQITGITDTAAVTLGTIPNGARMARITPENQPMRSRDDGTAPTSTVGMLEAVNTPFVYTGDLAKIRFCNANAATTNGILNVMFYA